MASIPHLLDQRRLIGPGGSTVSGDIYFYYSGTSVLAPIYKDTGLTIPEENPVSVGAGEIIPNIFLDSAIVYRRVIVYSDGTRDEEDPLGNLFSEGEAGIPVGTIMDYAGVTPPAGFLFCYGQELNRTEYPDLFDVLGTSFGSGNGTTTFNIPDYRGRVGAGKDNMGGTPAGRLTSPVAGSTLGANGGEQSHTLSEAELASHSHTATVTDPGHTHGYVQAGTPGTGIAGNVVGYSSGQTDSSTTGITVANSSTGSGNPHNNVQPTIVFNKVIKVLPTSFLSLIAINPDFTNKANASAVGVTSTATDLGVFSGTIIPDNSSAKVAIQALETVADSSSVVSGKGIRFQDFFGMPTIRLPNTVFFLQEEGTTTGEDVMSFRIDRRADYVGGTNGFENAALLVNNYVSSTATASYEDAALFILKNESAGPNQNCALRLVAEKMSTGSTWCSANEAIDTTGLADPMTGLVGIEQVLAANGTDGNNNRVGFDAIISRPQSAPLTYSGADCVGFSAFRATNQIADASGMNRWKKAFYAKTVASSPGFDDIFDAADAVVAPGGSAIRLAGGQKIAFTSNRDRSVRYDSGGIRFNNSSVDHFSIMDNGDVNQFGTLSIQGIQVLTSRRTGWTGATGTATRSTFVTSSVTLPQLAERVKALIDDLSTHGLIGA